MSIPLHVFLFVLFAALLHASWNAIIKSSGNAALDTVALTVAAALLAGLILPLAEAPAAASWPWLAASVVLHVCYFMMLGVIYRLGDLSQVYPLMRGIAPLLVALTGAWWLDETLSGAVWSGIALICAGILLPVMRQPRILAERTAPLVLVVAALTAAYTLVDGYGTRASGSPLGYCLWMFVLEAPPIVLAAWVRQRGRVWSHAIKRWRYAAAGAVCVLGSYSIALWAMTEAPIAAVAALRETSVLFAAVIGCTLLKEKLGIWRVTGAAIIAAGMVMLRL
jgi:drug/metabolite transporter (DMT)-like permease